ncbi:MAG: YfiR family protein [Bryobacteraceae bacterium]
MTLEAIRASLLCVVLVLGPAAPYSLAADESLEYQVKAAFVLNFIKFTEWPAAAFTDADSPVSICILGTDPFGNALDQLIAGESVNGRRVAVQRLKRAPSPKACQVLFMSKTEKDVDKILPALGPGVLSVGEGETFVRAGGVIAFIIENRRVRFDINQTAAENAELKLSSKLLSVARSIEK